MNSLRRILSVAKRILKQLRYDRRTLGMSFIMPILNLSFFILAFSGEVRHVPVIVVDLDHSPLTRTLIYQMEKEESLSLRFESSLERARQAVEQGDAWAAIVLPPKLHDQLHARLVLRDAKIEVPAIRLFVDKTQPQVAATVQKTLGEALQAVLEEAYGLQALPSVETVEVYGAGANNVDVMAPGMIGLVLLMVTFILTLLTVVREKNQGTLERLMATPLRGHELVLGYLTAFGLLSLVQSVLLLGWAVGVFSVHITGHILWVLIILVALAVGFQGLGIMLSVFAQSEYQALQFMPVVVVVSLLLSGAIWPLEALPQALRPLAYAVPLTYAVHGLRGIMLKGWGWSKIAMDVGILWLFALFTVGVSAWMLRRRS